MTHFDAQLAGLSLTEANGQVFLNITPVDGRALVDAAMLHTLLTQEGYGDCHLHEEAIAKVVRDHANLTSPTVALVADRIDAKIQVKVAQDEMTAVVALTPAHGGRPATVENILRALAEAGVVFGIDEAALIAACELGECSGFLVASGKLAQNGKDTGFEVIVAQAVDRTPKLDDHGLIDYRERGAITVVQSGAPLMRRTPSTPGVVGYTTLGRMLSPQPGRDRPFALQLSGAELASDDPNLLQAAVTGQPVVVTGGVIVEPILRVAEVNMDTGNLHFDGTVEVAGEVIQGMKVQATGDIWVKGLVDGGKLAAGGNIHIGGGVISHAKLKGDGSVSARFAQSSEIFAGTYITLSDMALECQLESLGQIIIGADAPRRGRLVGGTASATMLIQTPILGSAQGTTTRITLGANRELQSRYTSLCERVKKEQATEETMDKLVKQLTAKGDPTGVLERVKASWRNAAQIWGKSLAEKKALEDEIALAQTARLTIGVGLVGAVDLSMGSRVARLRREFTAGSFSIDPGASIVFTNVYGSLEPID
jgi:uncharacterized protein (DUF342 family)